MGMKKPFDPRLYLVTGADIAPGRPIEQIVEAAVRGGVTAVQLREKTVSNTEFAERAARMKRILEGTGIALIINDRPDVAAACGADGVHLGQSDAGPSEARRALGTDAIIGLSVETLAQAEAAEALEVDYLGVSPVFETPTKNNAGPGWGLDGLIHLRARTNRLLVAIGGINAATAAAVLAAGADGLAVVSAICSASDPESAARELREIIERFLPRPPRC